MTLFPGEFDLGKAGRPVSLEPEFLRNPVSNHPCDSSVGNQQRNPPPLIPRDLGIYEEILEFLLARHPERAEPITRPPAPEGE